MVEGHPRCGDAMLMATRKPVSVGEILNEEFMEPLGLTQAAAQACERALQRPAQRHGGHYPERREGFTKI